MVQVDIYNSPEGIIWFRVAVGGVVGGAVGAYVTWNDGDPGNNLHDIMVGALGGAFGNLAGQQLAALVTAARGVRAGERAQWAADIGGSAIGSIAAYEFLRPRGTGFAGEPEDFQPATSNPGLIYTDPSSTVWNAFDSLTLTDLGFMGL